MGQQCIAPIDQDKLGRRSADLKPTSKAKSAANSRAGSVSSGDLNILNKLSGNISNNRTSGSTNRTSGGGDNSANCSGVFELKQNYKISNDIKVLGAGTFGKVFLSESVIDPNFKVAIKVLSKAKLKDHIEAIREEVRILTMLDHPNIVKHYETYDDTQYMYLVMEHCPGGELFDKIARQKNSIFSESKACYIMKTLLRAVNHCHANGIVHRDIKPENIMIGNDGDLKIIDFGIAKNYNASKKLNTKAGTTYYMAPEVQKGKDYDSKVDVWSLGVLMYVLLSGYLPFQGKNKQEVYKKVVNGEYHLDHQEFLMVSDEGKALIRKMLVVDPKHRLSCEEALRDQWFAKFKDIVQGSKEDLLDPNILKMLREYRGVSALKKAALNILVKMADYQDIKKLREIFMTIDKDSTGDINAQELKEALMLANLNVQDSEIESIMSEVDYIGDAREINYSEFLSATISVKKILTEEKLLVIFNQFDIEGKSQITLDNIMAAMNKLGHTLTEDDIEVIAIAHNLQPGSFLDFNEFRSIFETIN